ncbi:hypothetical protein CAEBREN_19747 [Caenorhabditis brenneri]|uniref:Uncharacterized protein n=1 Tax=Caenorhabditis brenneri TaxID=135651 RepID=G0MDT0_CAEBE|nr:hypothetical protein CAEBREN_19747 [Caenorhabditis brenneri]
MKQSEKPLAYPCWKPVLRCLGAELRLLLSARCPEIGIVEKTIPIKLTCVKNNDNQLIINNTIYTIGVIRHYFGGYQPPQWAQEDNRKGGVPFDVGRFQEMDDFFAESRMDRDRAPSDEETARCFENQQMLQDALTKLDLERTDSKRKLLESKIEDLKEKIRSYNEQLAISQLKFEYYIMLSITTDGIDSRELLCYNVPLADAMKYLAEKLIGKRQIICNNVTLWDQSMCPNNLRIENSILRSVMEIDDREIKSIEIPCCNAKFEQIQDAGACTTPFSIKFSFYIPKSALDETMKSIHNMEQPATRKKLKIEDFPWRMETKLPCPDMLYLWDFTIYVTEAKAGEPGQDYFVNVGGEALHGIIDYYN